MKSSCPTADIHDKPFGQSRKDMTVDVWVIPKKPHLLNDLTLSILLTFICMYTITAKYRCGFQLKGVSTSSLLNHSYCFMAGWLISGERPVSHACCRIGWRLALNGYEWGCFGEVQSPELRGGGGYMASYCICMSSSLFLILIINEQK